MCDNCLNTYNCLILYMFHKFNCCLIYFLCLMFLLNTLNKGTSYINCVFQVPLMRCLIMLIMLFAPDTHKQGHYITYMCNIVSLTQRMKLFKEICFQSMKQIRNMIVCILLVMCWKGLITQYHQIIVCAISPFHTMFLSRYV